MLLLLLLLLLLLSHFSRVRLCATPETAAHQAPPSLGFSRQEHCRGLPFPSPMHESEKWKWSRSVMSDSCGPMDCSLPGSTLKLWLEIPWAKPKVPTPELYLQGSEDSPVHWERSKQWGWKINSLRHALSTTQSLPRVCAFGTSDQNTSCRINPDEWRKEGG